MPLLLPQQPLRLPSQPVWQASSPRPAACCLPHAAPCALADGFILLQIEIACPLMLHPSHVFCLSSLTRPHRITFGLLSNPTHQSHQPGGKVLPALMQQLTSLSGVQHTLRFAFTRFIQPFVACTAQQTSNVAVTFKESFEGRAAGTRRRRRRLGAL